MRYIGDFKDIAENAYQIQIFTIKGDGDLHLTLTDTPVIITNESNGLFSPIKSQSCTISILTDEALLDLYTTDPQLIRVLIEKVEMSEGIEYRQVIFRGYVTPCQYGQDWTYKDVVTLECVDCLSSLKQVNYSLVNGEYASYIQLDRLISYMLSKIEHPDRDELYHIIRWNWPQDGYVNINGSDGGDLQSTQEFINYFWLNEANFFDDDVDETPWTCYEVLEEICRFFNLTLTVYNGEYYFIDYLNVAKDRLLGTLSFWRYDLDGNVSSNTITLGNINITQGLEAGGTMEIAVDDVFNKISVEANRYDINELAYDLYDKTIHTSLTTTLNFGSNVGQTYTESHENFWGDTVVDNSVTTFKTYCVLDSGHGWKHYFWNPDTLTLFNDNNYGYNSSFSNTNNTIHSQYTSLPENKYINTIGATILHYAQIPAGSKPSKLDWNDVIMFNCLTDTIKPSSTNIQGKLKVQDVYNRLYEKPVLEYTSDYEMNFSPSDGTSWLVINNKLWYQQNKPDVHNTYPDNTGKVPVTVTNTTTHKQLMFPLEGVTSAPPYMGRQYYYTNQSSDQQFSLPSSNFSGWEMLQVKLQVGNKYWNGSQWTTQSSTFYIKYSGEAKDVSSDGNYTFSYLSWMNIVSNTTYQEKVGTDGYAIPIYPTDGVCGKLKVTIYTPRLLPHGTWEYSYVADETLEWYERGPVVFMKDFSIDYVYTDESPWWLDDEHDKRDLKYSNYTVKRYTYENSITCRINSWQKGYPIAKSFPIAAGATTGSHTIDPMSMIYYIEKMKDPYTPNLDLAQEENVTLRQLRHYSEPRLKVKVNLVMMLFPWHHVTFNSNMQLGDKVFVVDRQEYDVKHRNCTCQLIEFGDTTIH